MYETHWTGLSGPSWEREMDLQLSRHEILCLWAGTSQHRQTNRLYRRTRTGAAQRELLGVTASVSSVRALLPLLRSARRLASSLQRHGASQRSPLLVRGRRRFVVAWENQRKHGYGWSIIGAIFG